MSVTNMRELTSEPGCRTWVWRTWRNLLRNQLGCRAWVWRTWGNLLRNQVIEHECYEVAQNSYSQGTKEQNVQMVRHQQHLNRAECVIIIIDGILFYFNMTENWIDGQPVYLNRAERSIIDLRCNFSVGISQDEYYFGSINFFIRE